MTYKNYFSHASENYAKYRPHYPPELVRYLTDLCHDKEQAWDAGCGNGQLSLLLAQHMKHVLATDASKNQIIKATLLPNIEYVVSPAEICPLKDKSVSLVTVAQAAHWFDLPAFYKEVRRVLKPGGILALISYGNCTISPDIDNSVHRIYEDLFGKYWPPERKLVEDGYRDILFDFNVLPVETFEMKELWSFEQFLGYIKTWSAFHLYTQDQKLESLISALQNLEDAWSDTKHWVRWPLTLKVGTP